MPHRLLRRRRPPSRASGTAHSSTGTRRACAASASRTAMLLSAKLAWSSSSRSGGIGGQRILHRGQRGRVHDERAPRAGQRAARRFQPVGDAVGHRLGERHVEGRAGNGDQADGRAWCQTWAIPPVVTGSVSTPRRAISWRQRSGRLSSSDSAGKRASKVPMAMGASMRASGAPRQKWIP